MMTGTLAVLMALQAALGRLFPGQYRDAEWIAVTWIGNDWVTLAVAVPLLVTGERRAARGSARGLLLWLGAVAYAVYNYAFYLFGAALNAFFPIYAASLVVAVLILILALGRLDAGSVAAGFRPALPVRIIGGYLVFTGTALAAVWLVMWAAHVFAGRPTPVEPEAFKIVAALDLWLMSPTLAAGGVLLWRRQPWGFVVAAIAGIQGALYLLVLSVNAALAINLGFAAPPGELPLWGALALCTGAAAAALLYHAPPHGPYASSA